MSIAEVLTPERANTTLGGMADPTPDAWRRVDEYFADTLVGRDPALDAAVADQNAAGLPAIEVAPVNGKFLHLLTRIAGARRVLEIGTLGGYSTIWLARGIPDGGQVVSIEAEPANAALARASIDRAGIGHRVQLLTGRAEQVLPTLEPAILAGEADTFDLIFIDADKESTTLYLDWAARLGRPGTVVVVDNVGRRGEVVAAGATEPSVVGMRAGLAMLGADPRFDATALQTLDAKGWDGIAIALIAE